MRFACAARGKLIASVDLHDVDADDLPARLAESFRRHHDEHEVQPALAMSLVEQFTGQSVTATAALDPSIVHRIVKPIMQLPVTPEELLGLQYPAPVLVAAVLAAEPEARWQLAQWAAVQAVDAAGIHDERCVASFLADANTPRTMTPDLSAMRTATEQQLTALVSAINSPEGTEKDRRDIRPAGKRYWAMQALAYLAQSDDVAAALGATYCADIVSETSPGLDEDRVSPFVHTAERMLRSFT